MERLVEFLESILGASKKTSRNNYAFFCPVCNSTSRKLEINLGSENKEFHCWKCNASGKKLVNLLKRLQQPREIISELLAILNISSKYNDKDTSEYAARIVRLPDEYHPLWKNTNSVEQKNALKYLIHDRKISISEIIKYNIGFCERGQYGKMIVVPSYNDAGVLNYFVGRSYYQTEGFRHKNPNISKDIIGFELFVNWNYPIVLVEGVFDAMAIRRNAIPLFGKTISEELRKKIIDNKVTEIYICLDKDAQKQALEHAEEFMDNGINVFFVDLQQKDPAEIGFEKMTQIIKDTQPLTFNRLVEYKLEL